MVFLSLLISSSIIRNSTQVRRLEPVGVELALEAIDSPDRNEQSILPEPSNLPELSLLSSVGTDLSIDLPECVPNACGSVARLSSVTTKSRLVFEPLLVRDRSLISLERSGVTVEFGLRTSRNLGKTRPQM